MTLLELLVEELPGRGGWPNRGILAVQDVDKWICFSTLPEVEINGGEWGNNGGEWVSCIKNCEHLAEDYSKAIITREQYEAALAASKTEWDGEGPPPVGADVQCICNQFPSEGQEKLQGKILYSGEYTILHTYKTNEQHHVPVESVLMTKHWSITPIRSEADKRRDEIIEALKEGLGHAHGLYDLMQIYHLLNNGKIPHIRID